MCKYKKICPSYDKENPMCNNHPEEKLYYCGKYRELEKKDKFK